MSFGSLFRSAGRLASTVARSPIGKVASLVPGLGTAVSAVGLASTAYSGYKALTGGGNGSAGLPALPSLPGGSMLPTTSSIAPGSRSIFRNDPNLPKYLEQFAIPKAALRPFYRAPKGFVVLKDEVGDPYGLPKAVAKQMGLWKPAKKPLLSVRDSSAIKHAGHAIKKLQNAEKMARKIANWHSPRHKMVKNIIIEKKGK